MLRHASKPLCAAPKNGCHGMPRHAAAAHARTRTRMSTLTRFGKGCEEGEEEEEEEEEERKDKRLDLV